MQRIWLSKGKKILLSLLDKFDKIINMVRDPMKRLSASITAILLVSTLFPLTAGAYGDVDGTRYAQAYAHLTNNGVIHGYPDGSGRPYDSINRAEALKTLVGLRSEFRSRAEWRIQNPEGTSPFYDLNPSEWYAPYVITGVEANIVTGYPDHTFRPAEPIRLEEALAMIFRTYGYNPDDGRGSSDWYKPYLQAGNDRNLFSAEDQWVIGNWVNRGQFFDMIYRLDTVMSRGVASFDGDRGQVMEAWMIQQQQHQQSQQGQYLVQSEGELQYYQPEPSGPHGSVDQSERQYASGKSFAITIPRLGIFDLTITHPEDAVTKEGMLAPLKDGVGHLFSYPGRDGKIMIYGHSSGYPWDVSQYTKIFRQVNELQSGDKVYVTYEGTLNVYQVTNQQQIDPNDIRPFQGAGEELILFTCWPPDSTKTRLIIHAQPVGSTRL